MSTDFLEMANLFGEKPSAVTQYQQRDFEFILDSNNGSYASGQIMFNGQNLASKWVVWSDAKLCGTIKITKPTGTTWTKDTKLAFKNGTFGTLYGISCKTSNGVQLINDQQSLYPYNCIRHILENTSTWGTSVAPRLLFSKETDLTNTTSNTNFQLRTSYMKNYYFETDSFYVNVEIPLPDIHPMFGQLDFPVPNLGLDFSFYVNMGVNTQYPIVLVSPEAMTDATGNSQPTVSISTSGVGNTLSRFRISYPVVQFQAAEAAQAASMVKEGFSKVIEFPVTDIHTKLNVSSTPGKAVSELVSSSVVSPQKLHILTFPTGVVTQAAGGAVTPLVPSVPITNLQLKVNNQQFTNTIPNLKYELWEYLTENLPFNGQGSVADPYFTYMDYIGPYKGLNSIDISRLKGREMKPYEGCSLQCDFQFAADSLAETCDVYFIVERSMKIRFDFSHNDVKVVVGIQV